MELDRVSDIQMQKLMQAIEDLDADIHIQTATEAGIARREKILGITPLDTDTLDDRRMRVLGQWYDVFPYTWFDLIRRLNQLGGEDAYEISMDYDTQTLTVLLELTARNQYQSVSKLLEAIVPLWIVLEIGLRYNQYTKYDGKLTHQQMAAYTHQQLRKEVINNG